MFVFFGTSHRSAIFSERAVQNGLKIDLVVSQPPKPVSRKQILTENPTITMAKNFGIHYIEKLKELSETLKLCHSDTSIGVILDYNKIIPNEIIDLFSKGIINIHFSKLPQYRGGSPVQATILNGDKKAWISYFLTAEKLDEGPILKQSFLALNFSETTESLYQKLIEKAAGEIISLIDDYLSLKVRPHQQQGKPSYTKKLTTENFRIDWSKSSLEIDRLIRAAYPEPGAWTEVELQRRKDAKPHTVRYGAKLQSNKISETMKLCISETFPKRLKILKAHLEGDKLIPDIVQLEGKKPVTWKQFQEGHPQSKIINYQ